jgi:hypothetical protein
MPHSLFSIQLMQNTPSEKEELLSSRTAFILKKFYRAGRALRALWVTTRYFTPVSSSDIWTHACRCHAAEIDVLLCIFRFSRKMSYIARMQFGDMPSTRAC